MLLVISVHRAMKISNCVLYVYNKYLQLLQFKHLVIPPVSRVFANVLDR